MEGLELHTPLDYSICMELSKIFPSETNFNSQQATACEIDFYLNGRLHWGIELFVYGDGNSKHLSRYSPPNGKYVLLDVNDYAIVDLHRRYLGFFMIK